ncbi:MAG: CBS domain-containing protein [Alphaproteobacteria bacterium]|nr:CBS domain-containing protein [Alphaproteobacteria bacterium]
MIVSQILKMKGPGVSTVAASATLEAAATALARERIGSLVVIDSVDRILGIISERDIVRAIAAEGCNALASTVESAMTRNVATCGLDDSLESLMREMTARRVRHLPVVKGESLAGIVSIGDVVKHRLEELERERALLVDYVASG